MTNDNVPPNVGFDPAAMRDWMTTGAGADLTGQPDTGGAPVSLLPTEPTPTKVPRTIRLAYGTDQALKSIAVDRGCTVTDLVVEAVNAYLDGQLDTTPDPVAALRVILAAGERAVARIAGERRQAA